MFTLNALQLHLNVTRIIYHANSMSEEYRGFANFNCEYLCFFTFGLLVRYIQETMQS